MTDQLAAERRPRRPFGAAVWVRSAILYLDRAVAIWPPDRAGREDVQGALRLLDYALRRMDELPDRKEA